MFRTNSTHLQEKSHQQGKILLVLLPFCGKNARQIVEELLQLYKKYLVTLCLLSTGLTVDLGD